MRKLIAYFCTVLLLSGAALAAVQAQQRGAGQNPQQTAQPKGAIEGTVARADNGQPLRNARVNLQRANNNAAGLNSLLAGLGLGGGNQSVLANIAGAVGTVTSDANGRFSFAGVTPGQYQISAEREGFIRSEYGQRTPTGKGIAVSVAADQRLAINLKMLQASVVSGRVVGSDGLPASQAMVQAYTYQYSGGQRTLAQVTTTQTNDLGEYRLFWLQPGDYFVSVTSSEVTESGSVSAVDLSQPRGGRGGAAGAADIQQLLTTALGNRGGAIAALGGANSNPPFYYPGTIDASGAIPVSVTISGEVRGIDFNLRPIRAAAVSGRVVAPFPLTQPAANNAGGARGARGGNIGRGALAGQGRGADILAQLQQAGPPVQLSLNRVGGSRTGAGLLGLQFGGTPISEDGTFEMKSVAPGEYNLTATARDPNGQQYTARTRIQVGTADVTNVALTLRPGVEVRGKILQDGTPSQQFKMSNLRVNLVGEDSPLGGVADLLAAATARGANAGGARGGTTGGQGAPPQVADDGSFTLQNVGAMEYRVRVTGLPQGAYIEAGRIESTDALNGPFTIDNPGALLQLQLGFSPGRVTGTVSDSRGSAASGVQAVLVPDEGRRGRNDAYFTATTDQNGQFTFANVPPGRYKVFSWEDIPAGAYQYPDFIRRYEDRGQPITVNSNGAFTVDVRLIPAS